MENMAFARAEEFVLNLLKGAKNGMIPEEEIERALKDNKMMSLTHLFTKDGKLARTIWKGQTVIITKEQKKKMIAEEERKERIKEIKKQIKELEKELRKMEGKA